MARFFSTRAYLSVSDPSGLPGTYFLFIYVRFAAMACLLGPCAGFNMPTSSLFGNKNVARCGRTSTAAPLVRRLQTCMMSASLNSMTVAQLRDKLAALGDTPPSKLKKAELISRVQNLEGGAPDEDNIVGEGAQGVGNEGSDASVDSMTVGQLKEALKSRGLKVGGVKSEVCTC